MLKHNFKCIFLILLLFNFCQKDWGTQRTDIYTSLEGPSYSAYFLAEYYNIELCADSDSMKIGESVNITANVSRNDRNNFGVDLYYKWYVEDRYVEAFGMWYYNINYIFSPRLNGKLIEEGFNINSVEFTTSTDIAFRIYRTTQSVSDIVRRTDFLFVKLYLGFKNLDGLIKYFCDRSIKIHVYY